VRNNPPARKRDSVADFVSGAFSDHSRVCVAANFRTGRQQRGDTMAVNVAVVGATGAVGEEFLTVLAERNFPIKNLKLLASSRSAGKTIKYRGQDYKVEELTKDSFKGTEIALFSAGGSISKQFEFVQLCPIWPLLYYYSQIELELDEEDRNSWPGNVQADRMFGYTTINECKEDGFKSEPMVIEFFRTFFVPLDFLQHRYVIPDNKRLRLLPPYREKVAQAYASFIMRVSIENNRIQKKYKFKKHIENGVENFEFIDKDAHATKYVLTKKLLENGDENYKLTDLTSNEVIYNITNNVTD
jgi:hypothetical protein